MADKSFGVKELNLLNASGTPTVTSPNNLNLNANTVAISTSCTIGNNLTVTSTTNSANLNVTGIGTLTRGFATDLSVSGISTISQPSNANPHSLWDVVNNGSSAYRFTGPGQSGDENNPNIYLVRGQRYIFKVNASGHPFQLRVANGGAAYSDGVTNNGAQSGNVVINVQHDAPAQLYYQCTSHGGMVGNIYIVGGPQVISGVVTATTFVGNLTGNPTGSGANLTNLPAANLTGTLPAISGANLTSLPAQATIANNADNRVITGGSGVNLNGESTLTHNGGVLSVNEPSLSTDAKIIVKGNDTNNHDIITAYSNSSTRGSFAIRNGTGIAPSFLVGTRGGSETLGLMTDGTERVRIGSAGQIGLGGANYGTAGQVLTSQGSGSAVQWATPAVLQYKYRGNNTQISRSSSGYGDMAFGGVVITPKFSSSIMIVTFTTRGYANGSNQSYFSFYFNTSGGSYSQVPGLDSNNGMTRIINGDDFTLSMRYAHDHNTTNTLQYKVYGNIGGGTTYLNWDSSYGLLTVEEIAS